jgi:hypothetical protein
MCQPLRQRRTSLCKVFGAMTRVLYPVLRSTVVAPTPNASGDLVEVRSPAQNGSRFQTEQWHDSFVSASFSNPRNVEVSAVLLQIPERRQSKPLLPDPLRTRTRTGACVRTLVTWSRRERCIVKRHKSKQLTERQLGDGGYIAPECPTMAAHAIDPEPFFKQGVAGCAKFQESSRTLVTRTSPMPFLKTRIARTA